MPGTREGQWPQIQRQEHKAHPHFTLLSQAPNALLSPLPSSLPPNGLIWIICSQLHPLIRETSHPSRPIELWRKKISFLRDCSMGKHTSVGWRGGLKLSHVMCQALAPYTHFSPFFPQRTLCRRVYRSWSWSEPKPKYWPQIFQSVAQSQNVIMK